MRASKLTGNFNKIVSSTTIPVKSATHFIYVKFGLAIMINKMTVIYFVQSIGQCKSEFACKRNLFFFGRVFILRAVSVPFLKNKVCSYIYTIPCKGSHFLHHLKLNLKSQLNIS